MELKEIVFPTDFSPASERAGRVAWVMASHSGGRLHVIHVLAPSADPSLAAEGLVRLGETLGSGLRVEMALLTGHSAGQRIVDYAREHWIDLIAMGDRGRQAERPSRLGRVARAVVLLAPCLVLTIPSEDLETSGGEIDTVDLGRCLLCAGSSDESLCDGCRARIRAQALQRKHLTVERQDHG
jgi:nucleotide-binding universal stress UspA family protein